MPARPTPRYYILHGEDELARRETLQTLQERLGPPELSALNTTVFGDASVTLGELKNACDTVPFMAKRRLVIVHDLLSYLASSKSQKQDDERNWRAKYLKGLGEYLTQLPDTTRLVFVESRQLSNNHPVLRQANKDDWGYVRVFALPKDMVGWVRRRAEEKGGELSPEAAVALVQAIGQNQRLLDQEIDKLLAFVNYERSVKRADVTDLVPYAQEAVIFDAVDALGQRDGTRAAHLIHNLLNHDNDPLYLFAMIIRQIRLLIQIKELALDHMDVQAIAKTIDLHPFPTGKLHAQARNFSMEQLERIHHHLLEFDVQIKTGQIDTIVALDLLIAGLASPA
jgi:DNA polymerase-3 subunit delta